MPTARYDPHTAWYDEFASTEPFIRLREHVVRLLGPGPGRCLDLGCGTGLALTMLEDAGWTVTGVDASAEQLALARERAPGADRCTGTHTRCRSKPARSTPSSRSSHTR